MINNFRNGNKLGILILSKSRTQLGLLPVEMGAGNFCIVDGFKTSSLDEKTNGIAAIYKLSKNSFSLKNKQKLDFIVHVSNEVT